MGEKTAHFELVKQQNKKTVRNVLRDKHAIKGNGNTKWMLLSQIFGSMFVISTSFLLIRGFHMGMVAIYLVVILDETIRGITNYICYKTKYLNE